MLFLCGSVRPATVQYYCPVDVASAARQTILFLFSNRHIAQVVQQTAFVEVSTVFFYWVVFFSKVNQTTKEKENEFSSCLIEWVSFLVQLLEVKFLQ